MTINLCYDNNNTDDENFLGGDNRIAMMTGQRVKVRGVMSLSNWVQIVALITLKIQVLVWLSFARFRGKACSHCSRLL